MEPVLHAMLKDKCYVPMSAKASAWDRQQSCGTPSPMRFHVSPSDLLYY